MYRHAPGTIYRRALARVDRRAAEFRATRCPHCYAALIEAARLSNALARIAGFGPIFPAA